MHLRNSCTRSTSAWAMRQVPSGASGGRGLNGLIVFFTAEVPGHVGHQVLDEREGLHRLDGDRLVERQLGQPRHAHQPRHAVDLGRAGAALAALQFQRTARSFACSAWIWWTASSTTMPSETSVV